MDRAARIFAEIAFPTYCRGHGKRRSSSGSGSSTTPPLARHPTLAVQAARIHALRGSTEQAERWLGCCRGLRGRRSRGEGADRQSAGGALPRRSRHDALRRGSAVALLPDESDWRAPALFVYAVAQMLLGDNERANELFDESVIHAQRVGLQRARARRDGRAPAPRGSGTRPRRLGQAGPRARPRARRRHVRRHGSRSGRIHRGSAGAAPPRQLGQRACAAQPGAEAHPVPHRCDSLALRADPSGARPDVRRPPRHHAGQGLAGRDRRHLRHASRPRCAGGADRGAARAARRPGRRSTTARAPT